MMRTATVWLALSALVGGWIVGACNNENILGDETGGKPGSGGTGAGTGGAAGSGGALSTGGASSGGTGTLCGGQVCTNDQVCCGPPECGRCIPAMSGQYCPETCVGTGGQGSGGTASQGGAPSAGGSGGSRCGGAECTSSQVCCGPPECGRCVPIGSDIGCPMSCGSGGTGSGGQSTTGKGGSGASCVAQQGSCAQGQTCCSGLTCCAGVPVQPGQEYCGITCPVSDRNLKTAIEPVNQDQVLERLMSLPVSTWSYRSEGTGVRHLGPMAQDFQAAFGLGASDRTILQVDGDGVSLAAIQALARKVEYLSAENARLRQRLDELESPATGCRAWSGASGHATK